MSWLKLIPGKAIAVVATVALLMVLSAGTAWRWQANSYGTQLSDQALEHSRQLGNRDQMHSAALAEINRAAQQQAQKEQTKRLQLEKALADSSKTQHRKLTDAEKNAARLRDRLATTELRLSVLIASPAASGSGGVTMPATPSTGCLVDGASRADIDPGAAQRIVSIANRGDRAIIALTACQAYARKVSAGE